jgi:hypothetical protein
MYSLSSISEEVCQSPADISSHKIKTISTSLRFDFKAAFLFVFLLLCCLYPGRAREQDLKR